MVIFTGDVIQTCSVQLTASNGTAVQIRIPEGAFVYVERQGNISDCQLKYLYITAEEPCIFVFRHLKFRLFLRGDGINGSYINISQMTADTSATLCPDGTSSEGLYTSRVSQTNHCQAHEVDDLTSCNISRDFLCSFKFPGNCNATLGSHITEFQCLDDNVHSSHKALIVYPPGIITLDLARQNIVELNVNSFVTLKSLRNLILDDNMISHLNHQIFKDLPILNTLSLIGNDLNELSGGIFQSSTNLNELFLDVNKLDTLNQELLKGLKRLNVLTIETLRFLCLNVRKVSLVAICAVI